MDDRPSLHLDIEGCFNVRDAGGWPTGDGRWMRTGALYRADDPIRLTDAGRETIAGLGLRAVVDLRGDDQVVLGPGFADLAITHHLPLGDFSVDPDDPPPLETPEDLQPFYEAMVSEGTSNLVDAVGVIADHLVDGPVLVHCSLGKDRTGVVIAVVQAAIGVPLTAIAEEFSLSQEPSARRRLEMVANPISGEMEVGDESMELLWTAPAEGMAIFAQRAVDRYGSLEAWPLGLGVSPATVDQLRRHLVVNEAPTAS